MSLEIYTRDAILVMTVPIEQFKSWPTVHHCLEDVAPATPDTLPITLPVTNPVSIKSFINSYRENNWDYNLNIEVYIDYLLILNFLELEDELDKLCQKLARWLHSPQERLRLILNRRVRDNWTKLFDKLPIELSVKVAQHFTYTDLDLLYLDNLKNINYSIEDMMRWLSMVALEQKFPHQQYYHVLPQLTDSFLQATISDYEVAFQFIIMADKNSQITWQSVVYHAKLWTNENWITLVSLPLANPSWILTTYGTGTYSQLDMIANSYLMMRLSHNQHLTEQNLTTYDQLAWDWPAALSQPLISQLFVEQHLDKMTNPGDKYQLFHNPQLSPTWIYSLLSKDEVKQIPDMHWVHPGWTWLDYQICFPGDCANAALLEQSWMTEVDCQELLTFLSPQANFDNRLLENPNLSADFLKNYNWQNIDKLSCHPNFTVKLFQELSSKYQELWQTDHLLNLCRHANGGLPFYLTYRATIDRLHPTMAWSFAPRRFATVQDYLEFI